MEAGAHLSAHDGRANQVQQRLADITDEVRGCCCLVVVVAVVERQTHNDCVGTCCADEWPDWCH